MKTFKGEIVRTMELNARSAFNVVGEPEKITFAKLPTEGEPFFCKGEKKGHWYTSTVERIKQVSETFYNFYTINSKYSLKII
jgi:hypothetical protein